MIAAEYEEKVHTQVTQSEVAGRVGITAQKAEQHVLLNYWNRVNM